MDYENFKEQFVEDVKERLYEQGTEVDITVNTVNKLNESYEAMTVKPEGSNKQRRAEGPRCPACHDLPNNVGQTEY